MANNVHKCFVIMPFTKTSEQHTESYWSEHFNGFIKPLVESAGPFSAFRSDALRGDIIKEIISHLITSSIVIADLTDANPNVYWELGVRQSFRHATITIAQHGTKLPFDIGAKGTLFYTPDNHIEIEKFRQRFKIALNDCLEQPGRPDSHVLEAISGRGTMYEIFKLDEAIRRIDGLLDEFWVNAIRIGVIDKTAKENIENKTKGETFYTPIPLQVAAIELLLTTRYLEEDKSFYAELRDLYDDFASTNTQILMWGSQVASDEWFVKHCSKTKGKLEKLNKLLGVIQEKLINRK